MVSRGRERRGHPRGSSRPPPGFDQQVFIAAMGVAATTIAQASAVGGWGGKGGKGGQVTSNGL